MNKTNKFYSIASLFVSLSLFSQTKMISFKSHSGHSENFHTAVSGNLFDANFSNLGIRQDNWEYSQVDSVIVIDDNKTVIVGSDLFQLQPGDKKSKFIRRDTVYYFNFSLSRNFDSIKGMLKNHFQESNLDSTVIMKYDKKNRSYKEIKPEITVPQKEKSKQIHTGLLLGALMFSGASGIYRWKRNKKNHEK